MYAQCHGAYNGWNACFGVLGEIINHGNGQVWLEVGDVLSGYSCQLSLLLVSALIS